MTYSQWLLAFGIRRETERKTKVYKYCCFHVHTFTLYVIPILSFTMLLLTYANLKTCFSGMIVPRRAQWSKKVRAREQLTVPMARGHGLKKGLII